MKVECAVLMKTGQVMCLVLLVGVGDWGFWVGGGFWDISVRRLVKRVWVVDCGRLSYPTSTQISSVHAPVQQKGPLGFVSSQASPMLAQL